MLIVAVVLALIVASIVLLAGDRLPGYHLVDGPQLLEVGPGRGLHLGDVVVLAACLAGAVGAVRRGRGQAAADADDPSR